ncbi:MAG: oligosaccharide flippase family protein [Bacteroidales bacterium]|nr:oligosaccharide flippase family protein [Bacteroidales bacterium]
MKHSKKTLLAGSLSGVLQLLFIAALALLSIPLFIHKLGAVNYGLFSLLSLILTLPFFAGLGLNTSLVKFIARQGRSAESKSDILAVATIQLAALLLLIALIFACKDFFLYDILGVPGDLFTATRKITGAIAANPVSPAMEYPSRSLFSLFACLLFSTLFVAGMQLTRSILMGLQFAWVTNLLQMFYNLLFYGSMIVLLLLDCGLDAIGYGILAAAFLALLASLIVTRTYWKKTTPGTSGQVDKWTSGPADQRTSGPVDRRTSGQVFETPNLKPETRNLKPATRNQFVASLRKQLASGLQIFSAELVAYFTEPVSRILIAHFIGIRETGYFDIAIRIKAQMQGIVTRLFDPFLPWIAGIADRDRIGRILRDVEQKYLLLSLPLVVMLPFVMKPVLDLWLGTGNNYMLTTASLAITMTFLCTMAVLPVYYYLLSHDQTKKAILLNLATVIANAALFLAFYQSLGFYAAVVALCASAIVNLAVSLGIQGSKFKDQGSRIKDNAVSEFQSFRVSEFQGTEPVEVPGVSGFQGFRVSGSKLKDQRLKFKVQGSKITAQSLKFTHSQILKSSNPQIFKLAHQHISTLAHSLVRLSIGSRLALTVTVLFAADGLLYLTLSNPWIITGLVFPVTVILAAVLYKYLRLITADDIETYLGTGNRAGTVLAGFFNAQRQNDLRLT